MMALARKEAFSTCRFIWFLRPRVLGIGLARVGSGLPKVVAACAYPVANNVILREQAGDGVVRHDATKTLGENALHNRMPQ